MIPRGRPARTGKPRASGYGEGTRKGPTTLLGLVFFDRSPCSNLFLRFPNGPQVDQARVISTVTTLASGLSIFLGRVIRARSVSEGTASSSKDPSPEA